MNSTSSGAAVIAVILMVAGCGDGGTASPTVAPAADSTLTSAADATVAPPPDSTATTSTGHAGPGEPWFNDRIEVAEGRLLKATCYGTGSPAVIYLHGMIQPTDSVSWAHAPEMQQRIGTQTTYCEYERTNVGRSSGQEGPIPVSETVTDLHALVEELGLETPVVLLGGSFGGLVAYTYAGTYPDDVAGVVLLDPTLQDELALDQLLPEEWRLPEDAWKDSKEQIDHYGAYDIAQSALDGIPDVPGTIFVTEVLGGPPGEDGDELRQAIRDQQQALIGRFDPSQTITMDVPHTMMSVIPEEIAAAVLEIVAAAP
ncbi:alpha/beta fold hydrolase [Ornithinimicrobium cryptoxanthini]|uniref:Alpha/beta hydrolase n=1 Tax=Ornithinimicrobium cryptoxanthini TaxID=2934161 RepID=A0ABY4YI48_9MICO|nr:alpha/beta hydrolase [Ornithinimicrobium cryptoxanthini]USQ75935.1 alpha/beta hydrolase [Ornithinimicrobium cryptoxanthini]